MTRIERLEKDSAELRRIKEGIKRNEITMIVDGNDMCDWGWTTIAEYNRKLAEVKAKTPKFRQRTDLRDPGAEVWYEMVDP
jgi:hypothetical protein